MTLNRGSEWRKWDLHIHTPNTKLSDNFEQIGDEDIWKTYCTKIEESDVAVFGITDYFSVENYFTFIAKHKEYFPLSKKVFFPNVELRLEVSVNKSAEEVNIHIIFSNSESVTQNKIEEFLLKLDTNIKVNDAVVSCKNLKSKSDFEKAGIKHDLIKAKLKEVFGKDECYLIIAAANNAGLRPDTASPRKLNVTDEIDKVCDGFFGGEQNVNYYLDIERYETEEKAKSKPVISGCDAHSFNDIGEYLGKKVVKRNEKTSKDETIKNITWIKAQPTFEGLKQLTYEPEHRVLIQEDQPETKEDYAVIESISFKSNVTDKTFCKSSILLNQNLNCIIGGKSSGKSLLLYYTAKTIDEKQTLEKRTKDIESQKYSFETEINQFDFEVTWKDGVKNLLSAASSTKNRLITYIPQMHINRLAEKKGKDELNELIESFLEENTTFKLFYTAIEETIRESKLKIGNSLNEYYNKKREIQTSKDEQKKLGDKDGFKTSIDKKNEEIEELKAKASFKDDEEKLKFESLRNYSVLLQSRKSRLDNLAKTFSNYSVLLQEQKINIVSVFNTFKTNEISESLFNDEAAQAYITKLVKGNTDGIEQAISAFEIKLNKIVEKANLINESIEFLMTRNEEDLKPFNEKNKFAVEIIEKSKQIEDTQKIVDSITRIEGIILNYEKELNVIKIKIFTDYETLFQSYKKISDEVNKDEYSNIYPEDEIVLKSEIGFNIENFRLNFLQQLNKKSFLSNWLVSDTDTFDNENNYLFDKLKHIDKIKALFETIDGLTEADGRFNSGKSNESANKELLNDYFQINFTLKQKEEDILVMSPGKKGIILLILILKLSNAKHPILIDQPEDNLDNRTIYSKLKEFIKNRKRERQIIMVTHNANLVVPTDSENIIIANQSGQDKGKDNSEFRFDYINGALEETFSKTTGDILRKMGIREHVCDILEGGEEAFLNRENKYALKGK